MKVLFVCQYNRGRSQMVAELFNKYSENGHADSAGTNAETAGDTLAQRAQTSPGAQNVIDVMQEEGIDVSGNVQTQPTEDMLNDYDKIIVMAEHETIPSWLKGHKNYEYWHIDDPKSKGVHITRATREQLKGLALQFINR